VILSRKKAQHLNKPGFCPDLKTKLNESRVE
jgi:hypothetical protein